MRQMPNIMKTLAALASRQKGRKPDAPSAETITDPDVLRLFSRLEELKRLDRDFDVHGSSQHRYQSVRMSDADLARLEATLGCDVPDQCRRWLKCVGRGAGPGYGLTCHAGGAWSMDEPAGPVSPQLIRDVSELTPKLLQTLATFNQPYLFCVWSDRGLMRLCSHGCGLESHLIVAGPMKGHVVMNINAAGWDMPDGASEAFAAGEADLPPAVLPTFFEWMECWIERSISHVAQTRLRRIESQGAGSHT